MSKTKMIMIFSIVIIVIGAVLATLGFLNGGSKPIIFTKNGFEIYKEDELTIVKEDLASFDNIEIITDIMDVNIISGDAFGIEMAYPKSHGTVNYSVADNKLKVESESSNSRVYINFGVINTPSSYINIIVPSDAKFDVVKLLASSSDLNIDEIKAKELSVGFKYGDVNINNIDVNSASITMNSGELIIDNLVVQNTLTIDSSYGDVEFKNGTIKNLKTNQNSGSFDMRNIKFETSDIYNKYGDVELNDIASNGISIQVDSGDIEVIGELKGSTILNAKYGEIEVKSTLKESEYSYLAYSKYGDVRINNNSYENTISKNNSDKNKIEAKAESGDVDIVFSN